MDTPPPDNPSPEDAMKKIQQDLEVVRGQVGVVQNEALSVKEIAQNAARSAEESAKAVGEFQRVTHDNKTATDRAAAETAAQDKALDFLWRVYGANAEWIRFADVKAGAALTVNAALVAAIAAAVEKQFDFLLKFWWVGGLLVCGVGFLLFSLGYALHCIVPLLAVKPPQIPKKASLNEPLVYFGDIHAHYAGNPAGYAAAVLQGVSPTAVIEQVAAQVVANASVAWTKHNKVIRAFHLHALALSFILLTLMAALVTSKLQPQTSPNPTESAKTPPAAPAKAAPRRGT